MRGTEWALATRRLNWGEDRVMYFGHDGKLRSMPTSWTSEADDDPFAAVSAGRSYCRVDDLIKLVALLEAGLGGAGRVSSE